MNVDELRGLAEESVRQDHGFVDPAKLRRFEAIRRGIDWKISIVGHDRRPNLLELHMLLLADERDFTPPLPDWLQKIRDDQRRERDERERRQAAYALAVQAEWASLVEAFPVPVGVSYNYSGPHHYENWAQGADHIRVREDYGNNKLFREAGVALCATPSKAGHLYFADMSEPADRIPTCKACIRTMARHVRREAPLLLSQHLKGRR